MLRFSLFDKDFIKYSMLQNLVTYCYTIGNKYYKRPKITETKFRNLIKFLLNFMVTETAV